MELFPKFDKVNLNPKFAERAQASHAATGKLLQAHAASTGDVKAAADELYSIAKDKHDAFHALAETAPEADRNAARAAAEDAKDTLTSFLRGEKSHKIGGADIKLSDEMGKDLRDAFIEAESAHKNMSKPLNGAFGMVRTQKEGFSNAIKQNGEKMKFWSKDLEGFAPRAKAFAHGSAVVGSVVGMGDAILRSKDSNGEDRSSLMRMAEFVVAGGLGTVALIGGPAVAR